jgi:hypothetical protein
MPSPPRLRAALTAALLLAPSSGLAQVSVSAHATGDLLAGWTDNVLSQPRAAETTPGSASGGNVALAQSGPQAATFFTLRPGGFLLFEGPKTQQRVGYAFSWTNFIGRPEANSTAHQLDYSMLYALSARSEIAIGAGASYGQQNIFNLTRPAGQASGTTANGPSGSASNTANGQQPGGLTFLTVSAYEGYTYDVSNDWRVFQGASVGTFSVVNVNPAQSTRLTLENRAGTERRYGRDAIVGELYVGYLANLPVEANGARQPLVGQFLAGPTGRWRRDLSERFSSEAYVGIMAAFNPDNSNTLLGPIAGATLRFHDDFGDATAGYSRSFGPNVFLGQIFYGDSLFVNGTVPIFEQATHLRFSTGAGLSWSNTVDANEGRLSSTLRVLSADVGLVWDPRNGVNASLRYQYFEQKGNPDDERPLFSFDRNSVFLSVGAMFPYRYAAGPPKDPSGRVDRSDRPAGSIDAPSTKLRPPLGTPADVPRPGTLPIRGGGGAQQL